MCRATSLEGGGFIRTSPSPRLDIRAFYLRLSSSSSSSCSPTELTLVYQPAIGGAALELNGRALPPAAPAEVTLRRVDANAYASADRVAAAADGARFEVLAAGDEVAVAAEGVFLARGEGWRVECRRRGPASVSVAEVVVLAEGGVLLRDKARAASRGRMRCGATRLEGIPEEATDLLGGWGCCKCRACGDDIDDDDGWEVVGDASDDDGEPLKQEEEEVEMETVRWAMEMGVWAVCLGVGLLATARRFRRNRAFW